MNKYKLYVYVMYLYSCRSYEYLLQVFGFNWGITCELVSDVQHDYLILSRKMSTTINLNLVNIHHHIQWQNNSFCDENIYKITLLTTFQICSTALTSHHAAHYIPMNHLFYNWQFVTSDYCHSFGALLPHSALLSTANLFSVSRAWFCFSFKFYI